MVEEAWDRRVELGRVVSRRGLDVCAYGREIQIVHERRADRTGGLDRLWLMEHVTFSRFYDLHLINIELPLIIKMFVLSAGGLHLISVQVTLHIKLVPAVSALGHIRIIFFESGIHQRDLIELLLVGFIEFLPDQVAV